MKICDVKGCGRPGNNYVQEPMMDLCDDDYKRYQELVKDFLQRTEQ